MHISTKHEAASFTIDDDRFFLKPSVPVKKMLRLINLRDGLDMSENNMDPEQLIGTVESLLSIVMQQASVERYVKRMDDDDNPIDFSAFMESLDYIIGESLGKADTPESDS